MKNLTIQQKGKLILSVLLIILYTAGIQGQTFSLSAINLDSTAFAKGNPLYSFYYPDYPAVDFGDLDNDGDFDIVIGLGDGKFKQYHNEGTIDAPIWVEQTGTDNHIGVDVGTRAVPRLIDINNSGEINLIAGRENGEITLYERIDGVNSIFFQATNPLSSADAGQYSVPTFGNHKGGIDNDLDCFVGGSLGAILYFENTGNDSTPIFVERTSNNNIFNTVDVGDNAAPCMIGLNGDENMDFMVGAKDGILRCYFTNNTVLGLYDQSNHPFKDYSTGYYSIPSTVDFDNDSDPDVVITNGSGIFRYYENIKNADYPAFEERGIFFPGTRNAAFTLDYDQDGILDIVFQNYNDSVLYYKGSINNLKYEFTRQYEENNPFKNIILAPGQLMTLLDGDKDNDDDLIIILTNGDMAYFENTGTNAAPVYTNITGASNPFNLKDFNSNPTFTTIDYDMDGDKDIIVTEQAGAIRYLRNDGTSGTPVFTELTAGSNPFNGLSVGTAALCFTTDFDYDKDIDLVICNTDGTYSYYENESSVYTQKSGSVNPFNGIDVGDNAKASSFDYDFDGDNDLILYGNAGLVTVYENKINTKPFTNQSEIALVMVDSTLNFTLADTILNDIDLSLNKDTLVIDVTLKDNSALPSWLSWNDSTKTFSGLPAESDSGSYIVKIILTDRFFAKDSTFLEVVVNEAPIKTGTFKDLQWQEGSFNTYSYASDVQFTDAHKLYYSLKNLDGTPAPLWIALDYPNKKISGNPTENGSFTFVAHITDEYNSTIYDTVNIEIEPKLVGITSNNTHLLSAYPIPASNELNINIAKAGQISIIDLSGKTVLSKHLNNNQTTLDVSMLNRGAYFLIYTNNEIKEKLKIIID